MGARPNNRNAEKWNEETTIKKLHEINTYIAKNPKIYTLSGALFHSGIYLSWWSYISNKFRYNTFVFGAIKRIELILEARIVEDTLNGIIKSHSFAIFLLKNKHGYK